MVPAGREAQHFRRPTIPQKQFIVSIIYIFLKTFSYKQLVQ